MCPLLPRCLCWNTGSGSVKLGAVEAPRLSAALRSRRHRQSTSSLSPWKRRLIAPFLWLCWAPGRRNLARTQTPRNREREREEMDSGTFHSSRRYGYVFALLYVMFYISECVCLVCRVSSTSVEQARERGYHRALLLSDHRKDGGQTHTHTYTHCLSL